MNVYDLLGLFERFTPKFAKKYANLSQDIFQALQKYKEEIEQGIFPEPEQTYRIKNEVIKELLKN